MLEVCILSDVSKRFPDLIIVDNQIFISDYAKLPQALDTMRKFIELAEKGEAPTSATG